SRTPMMRRMIISWAPRLKKPNRGDMSKPLGWKVLGKIRGRPTSTIPAGPTPGQAKNDSAGSARGAFVAGAADGLLELDEALAQRAGQAGQAVAEQHQADQQDDEDLGRAQVEHGRYSSAGETG